MARGGTTCPVTQSWWQEYGYEAFGNRWVSFSNRTLHLATPTSAANFNAATNRLTGSGITYDNAGNLTAHPHITPGAGGGMVYNASNKMTQFTATGVSVSYRYDAQERRVRQDSGGQTTIWVYDAFGQLAAEYATNLAMAEGVYYRTTDHLGSTRIVTNQSADVVQRRDFFPFGEAIPADSSHGNRHLVLDGGQATYNATLDIRQQFTGQQRDAETGLDYFWARTFHASIGRFLSVDPYSAGARTNDPQSWNAYSYVRNRPLALVDPDGRDPECAYDVCVTAPAPIIIVVLPTQGSLIHHPLVQICMTNPQSPECAELGPDPQDPDYHGPDTGLEVGFDQITDPEPVLEAGFGLGALIRSAARVAALLVRKYGVEFIRHVPMYARSGLRAMGRDELLGLHRTIGQQSQLRALFGDNIAGARAALDRLLSGQGANISGLTRDAVEVYRELAIRAINQGAGGANAGTLQSLRVEILDTLIRFGMI
jgi:RHS repeat-associated protein